MASHSPALLRVKLTHCTSSKTTLLASLWLPVRLHLWPLCSFFCFFSNAYEEQQYMNSAAAAAAVATAAACDD